MTTQATQTAIDSGKIVERLLQRVSKNQLAQLVNAAAEHSGQAVGNVSFEPGDDLCPTFRFPYPFPPRIGDFLNHAALLGSVRLFPYGILNPEGMMVQVAVGKMER